VLDNLAEIIRERFKVKRQVRVISAHGRLTGWVLVGIPPALAFGFFLINPDHLNTLLDDTIGMQMLTGGLILQVVGTLIVRRIIDIEF
jgi:tight adherence protein B